MNTIVLGLEPAVGMLKTTLNQTTEKVIQLILHGILLATISYLYLNIWSRQNTELQQVHVN